MKTQKNVIHSEEKQQSMEAHPEPTRTLESADDAKAAVATGVHVFRKPVTRKEQTELLQVNPQRSGRVSWGVNGRLDVVEKVQ